MATDTKTLRMKLGWSQERLARELRVSFSTISRWERGEGRPSQMAERLLEELSAKVAVGDWPTADRIDIAPITGLFKGPKDLSTRHHHYRDPDTT
jgi:transcriptional regulator with XRE-family HTH domain